MSLSAHTTTREGRLDGVTAETGGFDETESRKGNGGSAALRGSFVVVG